MPAVAVVHRRHQGADVAADVEHGGPGPHVVSWWCVVMAVVVVMVTAHHVATDSDRTSKPLTGWSRYGKASR